MKTVKYSIPSIHCGHCVMTIEMEIGEINGVSRVKADLVSKTVEVDFDIPASEEIILAALKELNYPPEIGK
jgi:copper chaperone